ncbi:MAG: hypothetical protein NDJ18_00285, partial [candidate division Zixibacteria bacterium]|nr:hypothetical protein [candidate division Zixibacteria bacterium]
VVIGKGSDFETPLDQLGLGPVDTLDITIPAGAPKQELAITPENLAKGKELLAKAATTHGGLKAIKAVKTVSAKGVSSISTPGGDFPIPVEMVYQFPDKIRTQADVMGQKVIDIRNGDVGWKTDRTGGFAEKSADEIKEDATETARNTLILLSRVEDSTLKAVYAGEGEIDGIKVSKVAILGENGEAFVTVGIDALSGQVRSKEYWGKGMMGEGNLMEVYSDYKKSGAVMMPMTTTQSMDGQKMMVIGLTEVTINGVVPPGSFDKP